ncbi:pyruvate, phosphate dikinase [Candidatus Woesearchaeota archaeon]|jgi:pyruvate, orthophosphate dikinase|nr:pyruvate, phosphate dikinase [Candidatus Woesearchaeota archaeon]MBT6519860.1 pyruvate, phosphate dikinase [Candidatus Woesearchaeota archaeon]MBT7367152.1 pyruvate, phosphate dikinase [Candidatus Woesearchaeota archaeon]
MEKKYIYDFSEGKKDMKELLGGKGANLAEMTNIGIPVPFGFTITTEACHEYSETNKFPEGIFEEMENKIKLVEEKMGMKFGDPTNPLLLSVRSGAAVSMPGMMDTVLNLGLNNAIVEGMIQKTGNERFVLDSYRRFIQMFGDVVMDVAHHDFEKILHAKKEAKGTQFDTDLTSDDLRELITEFKAMVHDKLGKDFPEDPLEQLKLSIEAVFASWNNSRAVLYRKLNDITGLQGTAVNVQAMVYGNMGDTSGTGVCFTRDPATGENIFYGEYLMNAQGEDVVAGIRTPKELDTLGEQNAEVYKELCDIRVKLEQHYKEMQDMEFTIQEGILYILQTRNGKRTTASGVKMAVDMVSEGLITKKEALLRIEPNSLNQLLHKRLDPESKAKFEAVAKGLPASPGAAVGQAVFDAHKAHDWAEYGKTVVLVRTETSPEDLIGMNASQGILTSRGGMTSHAAVVARGMGKCCIAGCADVIVHEAEGYCEVKGQRVNEGDIITLDGTSGELFIGKIESIDPELSGDFETIMNWADEFRRMKIRTNADTPHDSEVAIKFGAEGIGLCRTEHMFFEGERIKAMREMILSADLEGRKKALAKLLPFQKADFKGIFEVMGERPVTIRLLDPPLHEFLPKEEADIKEIAGEVGLSVEKLHEKIDSLHEVNPMLGHRGCRLGITYPEITEMQTRAIIEAAIEVKKEKGTNFVPEIMIPLVGNVNEFKNQKDLAKKTADGIIAESGVELKYMIGTMIEVPRGALTADAIAEHAEFFSFGTNDLTQMTLGFSRDDVGSFVPEYIEQGIFEKDPFQVLDQTGVGQLVKMAVEKGRAGRENIKLGICGEHGGDPSSVEFCHKVGLDYVSCSPFRVPIARLAAAHAVIKESQ